MYTIDNLPVYEDNIFLEKSKKKYICETYARGIRKGGMIHYESYENATILPRKIVQSDKSYTMANIGVCDCNGNYVEVSRVDIFFYGGYQCDCSCTLDKTAVYCGSDFFQWGHFLVNVVPRLWIALRGYEFIDEYVIVRDLDSGMLSLTDNQIEFLQLLGIMDKVQIIDQPTRYKKVIVPEAAYYPQTSIGSRIDQGIYYDEFLDVYKYVVDRALENSEAVVDMGGDKKVYFSRSGLTNSNDNGIEVVDSFLENNGYEIVYPEKISLTELICYLHHCEFAAYLSGTLQHNMLFAPQGCKAIALERRLYLSRYQTDIDIMKKLSVTYVNVQYTFIPKSFSFSAVYAYTRAMKEYAERERLMLPDYKYTADSYLEKTIRDFLKMYVWKASWADALSLPFVSYYLDALEEDIAELSVRLPRLSVADSKNASPEYWKYRLFTLLTEYNVPSGRWDEKNPRSLIKTFSAIIERNIDQGKKDFLIFPFGANGMLFEQILRQCYNLAPKAVFDNHLAKYNPNIKELKEIDGYMSEQSCIVLTTLRLDCRKELKKHCDLYTIESPFSIW